MKTNATALVVPSPAAAPGTNDIRDIRSPVALPWEFAWLWLLILLPLIAAAILGGVLWWLNKRRRAALPPPFATVPPHERARWRLAEALKLIQEPKPFCTEVSNTVREYLEGRFGLRAPERTTEEFLSELQQSPLLSADQKLSLSGFLQSCDLVKFARHEPGETELRGLWDAAVRLLEETMPRVPEPNQPAGPVSPPATPPQPALEAAPR